MTGIGVVGDMPWGTHFCHLYETKEDLLDTLVPYFKVGLENQEFCVWVISEPLTEDEARNALRQAIPDLDRYLADGSMEIISGREWYLRGDTFDLTRVRSGWKEKLDQALARGYAGMRVTGNTAWLAKTDWKDFSEYEEALSESITNQRMMVLCAYPLAASGAAEILDVARRHQFAIARRNGNWEVIETPELEQANEGIKRLNEELEQRVVERTRQLTAVNEELRKEIIERKRSEQRLAVQYAITRALAESDTLAEAAPRLLQAIGESMGWAWGALWKVDREAGVLRCSEIWHPPNLGAAEFDAISREMTFTPGRGLPGRVWKGTDPIWIADATKYSTFVRASIAARVGLRGAIAFPILLSGETLGVVEFFSRTVRQPDREQLDTLSAIGSQIGQFIERTRAEDERQALASLVENSTDFIGIASLEGQARFVNPAGQRIVGLDGDEQVRATELPDYFVEQDRERFREHILPAALRDGRWEGETRFRHFTTGAPIPMLQHLFFITEPRGDRRVALATISRDITERKRAEEELQKQRAFLDELLELAPEAIVVDVDGRIVRVNKEFTRIFGYTPEEALGRNIIDLLVPDELRDESEKYSDWVRHGQRVNAETIRHRKDGTRLHVSLVVAPVLVADGQIAAYAIYRDITERKRLENELRRSEAYLAEGQRLSHTGSWAWNVSTGEFFWSQETSRIFGCDEKVKPSYSNFLDRAHPEDRPSIEQRVERAVRDRSDYEHDHRIVLPDGSIKYIHCLGHPIVNESGAVVEFIGTVMDVTERKRAETALRRARERTLEARFAAVLEERTRLAREIHDTLIQGFTGVALQLLAATGRVTGPPEAVAALRDVLALAQKTLADARQAVWDMRAPTPAEGDFAAALRAAAERTVAGTALALDYGVQGAPRPLDPDVKAGVFRVAQEAIANVVKHAAARTVRVALTYGRRGVRLTVADDGRGFPVDPDFHTYAGHWGLLGMRERASQLRAKLTVRSAVGQGTEVVLLVPYRAPGRRRAAPSPAG